MGPSVRPATASDVDVIADLLVEAELCHGAGLEPRVRRMIECSPDTCFVATDPRCIGLILSVFNGFHVVLSHIAVHPTRQREGTGRLLHDALVDRATSLGAIGIIADSRLAATGFFSKLGYRLPGAVFLVRDPRPR